ncbi:MAG: transketolase [Clostridia bacterium]|nr:transketolase [Clostridia bacterium]
MDNYQLAVNTLRVLSTEAIDKAKSGHPGLPLGAADVAFTLFDEFLTFNPKDPKFDNRDRFVLSGGHGSMLLYSLLHLFGYKVSIDDIKNFRQLGSITPGHPEYGVTPGVEISTGPLGQGIANAVGMAIAEQRLAAQFNRDGFPVSDHYTYALCGEGDLMEGIGYEASSLAGALKLNKLIVFYDCNKITIEGSIDGVFDDDIVMRQKALKWNVIEIDGNDHNQIRRAIKKAKAQTEKPTMIICRTVIGYGSPLAGSAKVHGSPLGAENLQKLKDNLGWTYPPFEYPNEIRPLLNKAINRGKKAQKEWKAMFAAYKEKYPELAEKYAVWMRNDHQDVKEALSKLDFSTAVATRNSGSMAINAVASVVENLFGGSADLTPSNLTKLEGRGYFSKNDRSGSNIQFGIREHAMGAVVNGIIAHGGLTAYCSTFFVFSDYMKNAVRLAALMKLPAIYVFTHDSIGVGEDGPTHQPVEQLIALRSIPGMVVYRPCDTMETAAAWYSALNSDHPTAICLTRQKVEPHCKDMDLALKGAYVVSDSVKSTPDAVIIATGSEVDVSISAKKLLEKENIDVRVVSMPSMEIFEKQTAKYRESVIPSKVKARVCVEAASPYSWYKYAGDHGTIVAMNGFGVSAKYQQLFEKFGFTAENIAENVKKSLDSLK